MADKKKKFRGHAFHSEVLNLEEFQRRFRVSNKTMFESGADRDFDINVMRRVLRKDKKNSWMVRYNDTGDQFTSTFMIYKKRRR